ncbi:MAG: zf-HC2 domain-containing protein [Herpetosiphonaceae bacterium]|nr:zf-HC2 domain-containing protein [Herpetosiphonaceae bacterium]
MSEPVLHTHNDDPTERLSALLDDALTGTEQERAQQLVDDCPACRADLAELRTMQGWLRDLPVVVPARSFTLDPAQYRASSGNRWFGLLRWGSALAILLAFLGIGIAALRAGGGGPTAAMRIPNSGAATNSQPFAAAGAAATMAAAVPASAANDSATTVAEAATDLSQATPYPLAGAALSSASTAAAGGAAASNAQGPVPPQAAVAPTISADSARHALALAATPTGEQLPTAPPLTSITATPVPSAGPGVPLSVPSTPARGLGRGWIYGAGLLLLVLAALAVVLNRQKS